MPSALLSFPIKVLAILLDFLEMLSRQLGMALKLLTDIVATLEVQRDFAVLHQNHCGLPLFQHDSSCAFQRTYLWPCARDVECFYLSCDCTTAPEAYACVHQRQTMHKIVTFRSATPGVDLHVHCKNSRPHSATFVQVRFWFSPSRLKLPCFQLRAATRDCLMLTTPSPLRFLGESTLVLRSVPDAIHPQVLWSASPPYSASFLCTAI